MIPMMDADWTGSENPYTNSSTRIPAEIPSGITWNNLGMPFSLFLLEFLPKILPDSYRHYSKNRSFFWNSSLRNLRGFCILTVSPRVHTDIPQNSFQRVSQHCSQSAREIPLHFHPTKSSPNISRDLLQFMENSSTVTFVICSSVYFEGVFCNFY